MFAAAAPQAMKLSAGPPRAFCLRGSSVARRGVHGAESTAHVPTNPCVSDATQHRRGEDLIAGAQREAVEPTGRKGSDPRVGHVPSRVQLRAVKEGMAEPAEQTLHRCLV